MIERLQDAVNDVISRVAVNRFIVLIKFQFDLEQRNFRLRSPKRLDLFSCIVSVEHSTGVFDHARDGEERTDTVNESVD